MDHSSSQRPGIKLTKIFAMEKVLVINNCASGGNIGQNQLVVF
jgi:hypothetical protein